ncbi:MAG TPA: universal stress protein [Desulfobacteraceae bacterium]|nr:universal stress protein [Deltaproteobacteria bacterium]HDI60610.1 universal stress protein [Desulfobacteraceae bacterium]
MELPSVNIKKVLYTTDLSWSARYAFSYALSLAGKYEASLVILHVIEEIPNFDQRIIGYITEAQWKEIRDRRENEAREQLIGKRRDSGVIRDVLDKFYETAVSEAAAQTFGSDEIVLERGNAVQKILEVAEDRQCDLIVMGAHGHGTLADAMLGSTAQRVLRRATVPVLTVRLPD